MATDHYTRLGIEKEKFDELNEKEKEELVEKQFKKIAPKGLAEFILTFLPKFLVPKKLQLLESARDILKDEEMRNDYDYLRNQEFKFIGEDITYLKLKELKEPLKSIARKREERLLNEQIEQKKGELEKIKGGRETQKYGVTNKIATHLESELKGLMENVLKIKTAKINDLDSKLQRTGDEDERSKIKGEITKIVNEYSKLFEEFDDLDSKQPKKEVGQQAELTNIPPKFTNISTEKNLKDQFEKGLEKAGIDIKGMGHKEVLEKLKDNFLLNAQYEMIKEFEEKSEQPEQEKSANQAKSSTEKNMNKKAPNIPLTDNVKKLVSNASKVNQSALLPKSSKAKPVVNMPIISPLPSVQKLIDQHETSKVDGTKLNHESDINNNPEGKFTQQISQEREVSEQQKSNGKSM